MPYQNQNEGAGEPLRRRQECGFPGGEGGDQRRTATVEDDDGDGGWKGRTEREKGSWGILLH